VGKSAGSGEVLAPAAGFRERFLEALDDDINTAAALGMTSELLTLANKLLDQPKSAAKDARRRTLEATRDSLGLVSEVLGVFGQAPEAYLARRRARLCTQRGIDPAQVEARIQERDQARREKDFARADAIRGELTAAGVELMDGAAGTGWRVTE
jgi:cysteinyl-tRNA synthetase